MKMRTMMKKDEYNGIVDYFGRDMDLFPFQTSPFFEHFILAVKQKIFQIISLELLNKGDSRHG